MDDSLSRLEEYAYELRYARNLTLRLARHFWVDRGFELWGYPPFEDAVDAARFTDGDLRDLGRADFVTLGRPRRDKNAEPYLILIEVSVTVDVHDVERAHRRAEILRHAGLGARACVDGDYILSDALSACERLDVFPLVRAAPGAEVDSAGG